MQTIDYSSCRSRAIAERSSDEYHLSIKEIPSSERPRERLLRDGAGALDLAQLLAIVLGSGHQRASALEMASKMLSDYSGLDGLSRATLTQLQKHPGIGPARAVELQAVFELGRRAAASGWGDRLQIRSPSDVANMLVAKMSHLEQEELRILILDTKSRLLDNAQLYKGSLNSASVRVGELFKEALRQNAASIILVHNHPSGDPTPSPEDVSLTAQVSEAGRLLDVEVLDHLVIGGSSWVSLKSQGLGFGSGAAR